GRSGTAGVLRRVATAGALLVSLLSLRPQEAAAVSPDGRITARLMTECPLVAFACLFGSMEDRLWTLAYARVDIVDNRTGEKRTVFSVRERQDAWEDWRASEAVLWGRDGKSFECRFRKALFRQE